MYKLTIIISLLLASFLGLSATVGAQPVLNPENGHYYECVQCNTNWYEANEFAASLAFNGQRGHLATSTSAGENDFILSLSCDQAWLGGFQTDGVIQPDLGWNWITGEPFEFTAWAPGEPNGDTCDGGCQRCIELSQGLGGWNDLPCRDVRDCVVEYGTLEVASPIPTLSEWGMIAAAGVMLLAGAFYAMKRRKAAA